MGWARGREYQPELNINSQSADELFVTDRSLLRACPRTTLSSITGFWRQHIPSSSGMSETSLARICFALDARLGLRITPYRWRAQFRTDKLYSEINFVLSRFCQPYYELFGHVDRLLSGHSTSSANASLPLLAHSLLLLIQLFHDLSSQDLPPFFEENMIVFMGDPSVGNGGDGWLKKYLSWERDELKGDVSSRFRRNAVP